jgi:hypothetical protein
MTLGTAFARVAAPAFGLLALSDGAMLAILGRALALATGVAYVGDLAAPQSWGA